MVHPLAHTTILERLLLKPDLLNKMHNGLLQVVVAPSSDLHLQTFKSNVYDPSLSGELRAPMGGIQLLPMGERKIIAHRAFFEIPKPGAVVNLGVGMPEVRACYESIAFVTYCRICLIIIRRICDLKITWTTQRMLNVYILVGPLRYIVPLDSTAVWLYISSLLSLQH